MVETWWYMFNHPTAPFGSADSLQEFVRRAGETPVPSPSEADRLAEAAANGDDSAERQLVAAYARIVVDEAIRYRSDGARMRDLVPDGVAALSAAARGYTPRADDTFARFARSAIREAMGRRFAAN